MNKNQAARYAIFSAEQVLDIYERKYPDDKRPRNAIEAAKAYLKHPCAKTKAATAYAAAYAYAAASAAYAASAYAAAYAAASAYAATYAYATATAVYAAYAAYAAAVNAATYTYAAAERRKMQAKILKYGIGLLKQARKEMV